MTSEVQNRTQDGTDEGPESAPAPAQDRVLIVDFGSQVTQLIARRVREAGVYSEIVPCDKAEDALGPVLPRAIILSGGPASVTETGPAPVAPPPPAFRALGISTGAPFAAIADDSRRLYGVQFHPEVMHTPNGAALLANFVRAIAGCAGDWTMAHFRDSAVARIRAPVRDGEG